MKKSSKKNMIKKVRKVRSVQNAKTTWNKEEILKYFHIKFQFNFSIYIKQSL